jgi:hypothetical protein
MVTHCDVDRAAVERALAIYRELLAQPRHRTA